MSAGSTAPSSRAFVAALALASVLALSAAGTAAAGARPGAGLRSGDAATLLRAGRVAARLSGPPGLRLRVQLTLSGTGTRRRGRRALAAGVPASAPAHARLSRRGRATVTLLLNAAARQRLRAAVGGCRAVSVTIHLLGHRVHRDVRRRLGLGRGCPGPNGKGRRPFTSPLAPGTPGGGFSGPGTGGPPAHFAVGAAVTDFSPPPAGQAPGGDPAACDPTGAFDGAHPFAFTEPYRDLQGHGHFDGPGDPTSLDPTKPPSNPAAVTGDPYVDCNGNGRWEGNLLGGGTNTPRFYDHVADAVTARAMVVSNGSHTIAVEVVDQEGLFDVYQQQIRDRVAQDGVHLDGIFISATHDESAPDSLGLGGVTSLTSGVNDYWVSYFVTRSAQAIEQAYRAMRPATITYTETLEPANLRQCWSSYPFVDDQHIPVLQAVGSDGLPIVTLASVSQHAETLGFNGGTPTLDGQRTWVSADWPHFFRDQLEQRYGGVAIEMAGAVGSVESPEVYPTPISRLPQHLIDASHPAGCRTLFGAGGQDDKAGSGHVPLGYTGETQAFGRQMGDAVIAALDSRAVEQSHSNDIWGERVDVCIPLDNLLFAAAAHAGVFAHRPGYNSGCSVQFPVAPDGSTSGQAILTQAASFRIGDGQFLSIPGEVFPFTYLRGFQGPQDMQTPQDSLPPWLLPHMHTPFRFIDGLAEDMIGYIFPQGNAVGVPTASNPQAVNGDTDRFGCNHSDDSEAASPASADLLGQALVPLLDRHGGAAETIVQGRYVLPDGTLSRDPLGGPQLKCATDTTFRPDGPAVAVELAGGAIAHPAAWMSLSGLPQTAPDRDTRGYFDASGRRVWLEVFPDLNLP
jgi:hypothetical protein